MGLGASADLLIDGFAHTLLGIVEYHGWSLPGNFPISSLMIVSRYPQLFSRLDWMSSRSFPCASIAAV